MDHQVKVRGFRVEPGEIESVLREHPSVREALVRACENGFGEKRLVGYLLPSNGAIPVAEVREFLKSRLPFYMVPAHLIRLDAFPLTPNGKVDYSRLPPADGSQWGPVDCVPPRDADEQVLAEIWMEVLGLKR
ncbi:MAG TPA: non-ribosomal peptide synthetase, partial [Verrucomicrobiota bacterium]|nr:non-ribosomal peptide synthetase [Verrucomicrobiota bacterium]